MQYVGGLELSGASLGLDADWRIWMMRYSNWLCLLLTHEIGETKEALMGMGAWTNG